MIVKCIVCNKEVDVKPSRLERVKTGVSCSRECRAEHFKNYYLGSNNPRSRAKNGLTPLEVFFSDKCSHLKHTAEQRGISFNLTPDQLLEIYNKQNGLCYYTGIPLKLVVTENWKEKYQADLDTLSVDRLDSNGNYEISNIVLCCNAINKLKGSSSVLETQGFLNFIALNRNPVCHIDIKKLHPEVKLPEKSKLGDAGYDLMAMNVEDLGDRIKVGTGVAIQPAAGWYCEVYDRSSNHKKNIMLINSVGIIDNGYTGEITLIFYKIKTDAIINVGDRIAQLIPKQYALLNIQEVESFSDTSRGSGGFGSTGIK